MAEKLSLEARERRFESIHGIVVKLVAARAVARLAEIVEALHGADPQGLLFSEIAVRLLRSRGVTNWSVRRPVEHAPDGMFARSSSTGAARITLHPSFLATVDAAFLEAGILPTSGEASAPSSPVAAQASFDLPAKERPVSQEVEVFLPDSRSEPVGTPADAPVDLDAVSAELARLSLEGEPRLGSLRHGVFQLRVQIALAVDCGLDWGEISAVLARGGLVVTAERLRRLYESLG